MTIIHTFDQNLNSGGLVTEFFSGELRHRSECNQDIFGNWRLKQADVVLQDQSRQKSKIKGGNGWQRGYMLL